MQVCHHNPTDDFITCVRFRKKQKVQLLLVFMTYCLETLGQQPPTIPGIMSGLRHSFRARFIGDKAFDHPLVMSMKADVSRLPYTPRTRLPCTFDMVQHIIYENTQDGFSKQDFVKAVAIAWHTICAFAQVNTFQKHWHHIRTLINLILNQSNFK